MMKVATVVGTRPEIIRLSEIIKKLDLYFNHLLIHTGQNYNYELNQVFFENLDIRNPDYYLNCAEGTSNVNQTIGNIITNVGNILLKEKPEALLVLGDTNSCLSVIAAKRLKIPIFHLEAGNRCFDMRVPEEINRKIVDHTSDINLTYSSIARDYLIKEGIPADLVIKVGSPIYEVLNQNMAKINSSKIINQLNLQEKKFILISIHREENIDSNNNFLNIKNILNKIADLYQLPIIVSTHPRTEKQIKVRNLIFDDKIKFIKPLGYFDYIKLQITSKLVISDSGTITEEASILNIPAINLRESHERPEGMEEGAVMMTGISEKRVLQAIKILEDQGRGNKKRLLNQVIDYSHKNVSDKVIRIIMSYTDYVNRVIWKKY